MNRKQLIILIVLVALIGGAGWIIFKRQNSSQSPSDQKLGQKLFTDLPVNDIAQIHIQQSGAELNLVKKDGLWRVQERGDYAADFNKISDFLLKAKDLKVSQSEEIGPSQFAKLELLEPAKGANSGTLVEFKDKSGKAVQSVILGKKQMRKSAQPSPYGDDSYPAGRYVLLPSDTKNVLMLSDALSDIEAQPANWLDKEFFKVEKVRTVSLTSTNATNSWKLTRETESGSWALVDAKPTENLDTNKVSGIATSISSPNFVDVVTNPKPEQTGLDKPLIITLETFDNFTYTLKIGNKSGEENYHFTMAVNANFPKERVAGKDEKPEDKTKLDKEFSDKNKQLEEKLKNEKQLEKWTYLVAKWPFDPLLKDRAQLMVEKKEEAKDEPKGDEPANPASLDK